MPAIPAAKNLAAFSLFVCRRALEMAVLALASADITVGPTQVAIFEIVDETKSQEEKGRSRYF